MNLNNDVAIVDIGSNSVRLMLVKDGRVVYKKSIITRLSENLSGDDLIKEAPFERTMKAVLCFIEQAKSDGADEILAFATACVRRAKNGVQFANEIEKRTGVHVEIVSGETEAELGLLGALNGGDGGVIDVGGASTEVVISKGGKIEYAKSVNYGAVITYNECGDDLEKTKEFTERHAENFQMQNGEKFYAIGGTATAICALALGLTEYDASVVHGTTLSVEQVEEWANRLFSLSERERMRYKSLQPQRATVIAHGAFVLLSVLKRLNVKSVVVSESDNLEGYLIYKRREYEQTN